MQKGFTLLELLIVIAILAILTTAVVLIMNPAEAIERARDTQRISDLDSLKTAVILWYTEGNTDIGALCCIAAGDCISTECCNPPVTGANPTCSGVCTEACAGGSTYSSNDGEGWLPMIFTGLAGGSPMARLATDPVNDATYYYEYGVSSKDFEFRVKFESEYYKTKQDFDANDGGDDDLHYEVGTLLTIL